MLKLIELAVLTLAVSSLASGQATNVGAARSAPAAQAAKAPEPKFKAIWEPVPFSQDIELTAIACTGPETCWVAGAKSTILHTTDGGKTWQAQLGGGSGGARQGVARI